MANVGRVELDDQRVLLRNRLELDLERIAALSTLEFVAPTPRPVVRGASG